MKLLIVRNTFIKGKFQKAGSQIELDEKSEVIHDLVGNAKAVPASKENLEKFAELNKSKVDSESGEKVKKTKE